MTRDAKRFLTWAGIGFAALICILIIVGLISNGGAVVGENKTYEVTGEVRTLDVDISAADFCIRKGDSFSVESNLERLTFRQRGSRLILTEKSRGNKDYDGAFLTIYIPDGTVFDEINISTGAGRFTADLLSAQRIDLDFGAGEVNIGELNATREAEIDGGAGEITIGGGSLTDLQLDMGVGALYLTTAMVGEGELNLGIGEAKLVLLGNRDDYTVELNKGIGDIRFDGESLPTGRTIGNGQNDVEINGGIGSIEVEFK